MTVPLLLLVTAIEWSPWAAPIGVIVAGLVGAAGHYAVNRWLHSGDIDATDARTLWEQMQELNREQRAENKEIRAENQDLRAENRTLKAELRSAKAELRTVKAENRATKAELATLAEVVRDLQARVDGTPPGGVPQIGGPG